MESGKANRRMVAMVALCGILAHTLIATGGNLEPIGPPGPTMHSLDEIYNLIGSQVQKAFDCFMKVEGVDGESADPGHADWIEILAARPLEEVSVAYEDITYDYLSVQDHWDLVSNTGGYANELILSEEPALPSTDLELIDAWVDLLFKYAEATPKSFICKGDSGTTEFKPADDGAGALDLIDL